MQGALSGDRRPYLWASLVAASLALWLLFRPTQPHTTISAWDGGITATYKGAPAEQPVGLSALLDKQEPRDTRNTNVTARPALPAVRSTRQEPRVTRNAALAALPQPQDIPWGNPMGSPRVVITQGYGVGTHAPAAIAGGIDLAIDGDGDGQPNPSATWNAPLYATMRGVIEIRSNLWPAGNHVWIKNKRYKVGYAHLQSFAVKHGQLVERGDLIGYTGATGYTTGPHLHYHIWEDGINVNPLKFGALP
jgi:murein DD-endopeptidase MepM/ murein hydrolase activator NlpD